ncbi:MAG: AAA family ATPase [Planctomycetaceae bacterium]|jgi:uncharacterized protein YhaN|nr:AAA family ATPase [Planctomycetaceae bacterium]
MQINGFEIERFGIWSGLTVSKLYSGINVFYGANEAGKSTIMEFVRAGLYGFDTNRRQYARRSCVVGGSPDAEVDRDGNPLYVVSGGILNLESSSGSYSLRRLFHPDRDDNFETVELKNANGEKEGTQLLRVLISGVDEQTFNNVFAIGLDEIQRLGSLDDTDAADMLFQLSVGMERISIVDTIKELTNKRNKILNQLENENKPSLLIKLLDDRKRVIDEIDNSKLLTREYVKIRDERRTVDRSITILENELDILKREKRLYEIAKHIEPIWIRRNKIRHEIDLMGNITVVQDETIQKLEQLTNKLNESRNNLTSLKTEYQNATAKIKTQPVNETLLKFAPRLEVLLDEEPRIFEIASQITSIENEIKKLESRIEDEDNLIKRGRRSTLLTSHHDDRPVIGNQIELESINTISNANSLSNSNINLNIALPKNPIADYRIQASAVFKAKKRLHKLKEEYTDILGRTKGLGEKLKPELTSRNVSNLAEAIERARELSANLKRRQAVSQRLTEMTQIHRDLHRANAVLVQNQTMSSLQVAVIGLIGIVGMIPAGLAMFELMGVRAFSSSVHPILVLFGVIVSGGAVAYKFISEKTNAGKLRQNQRQLGHLISQIEHAKQEAADIDASCPDVGIGAIAGSVETRYREAQQELQLLEKLLPIDAKYQEANQQRKKLESKLQESKERLASATKRWKEWLKSVDLPVDWQPSRVRDLVERSGNAQDLRKELERCHETLDQRTKDMHVITDRIDRLTADAGLTFADGVSYVEILREVKEMLDANDVAVKNRKNLIAGLRPFKKKRRNVTASVKEAKNAIADLLNQYKVKTPDELRSLNKLHQKHRKLLQQEQGIQRELDAAIGGFCAESVVADILEPRVARKLRNEKSDEQFDGTIATKNNIETDSLYEIDRDDTTNIETDDTAAFDITTTTASISSQLDEPKIKTSTTDFVKDGVVHNQHNQLQNQQSQRGGDGGGLVGDEFGVGGELLPLGRLLESVSGRIASYEERLRVEIELRGKLAEQMRLISEDQTFFKKQRELAVIDRRIADAKLEWQTYSVCCCMLDSIRETYERERQPKTLAEASELLRQLTEGKYVRIWTPLGDRTLMIDDAAGNTFDVTWISRGTREMLFIAIRLALASAFAQHGSVLPIILDDVLVNFDTKRSMATAKLLIEYAKSGKQIFVFTCHEHVCRIFQKLDVPVRILPPTDNPSQASKVLLPMSILKKREAKRRKELQQLAISQARTKIQQELAKREEQIRKEEARKAEVQRMILQLQQQATAAITVDMDRKELQNQ